LHHIFWTQRKNKKYSAAKELSVVRDYVGYRTIGELVAKNQSTASRLQNSLDRLAAANAENQSLKAALKTSASASLKPVNVEGCHLHRGNALTRQCDCTLSFSKLTLYRPMLQ